MSRAHIVMINVEAGDAGLYHATSPQMKELFISRESVEELLEAVPHMIREIYDLKGEIVTVIPTDDDDPARSVPWVVLPQDVIRCIRAA